MKWTFGTLAVVSALSLTSCDNATSKIKDNNASTATNAAATEQQQTPDAITAQDVVSQGTPEFSFENTSHDFGAIEEGQTVEHTFSFTNTGDAPLIISNARASCGCTVPEWPRQPIAPGETGRIKVSFDSSDKPGVQKKNVTLSANTTPNTMILNISAQVNPKQ